jgi:hypothetical protein
MPNFKGSVDLILAKGSVMRISTPLEGLDLSFG